MRERLTYARSVKYGGKEEEIMWVYKTLAEAEHALYIAKMLGEEGHIEIRKIDGGYLPVVAGEKQNLQTLGKLEKAR